MEVTAERLSWKLSPPEPPWFAVARPGLVRRLDAAFTTSVTLVAAPPGYGKSLLLAEWAARRADRRITWLAVESADEDPARLARHLVAALGQLSNDFDADLLDELEPGGGQLGDRFVSRLLRVAEGLSDAVLVIEDLDRITDPRLLAEFGLLVEHLPAGLHLVISARVDPAMALHRGRVRGDLVEVRADDLRFLPGEAAALVQRIAGRQLTARELERLMDRTGGWPLAIQHFALTLRAEEDPGALLDALEIPDRNLADYLVEEVLAHQPADVRAFLLDTSVLETISAPLCDHVLGRSDSGRILSLLDRQNLFLAQTDPQGWFRYAALFRDLLRLHLRSIDSGRERVVLRAAADWFAERGDLASAGRYLVAAEDWDALLDLALQHSFAWFERGELATPLSWFAALPASVASRAQVRLAQGFLLGAAGEPIRADERFALVATDPASSPGEVVVARAFRSLLVQFVLDPQEALNAAALASAALDADPGMTLPDVFGIANRESLQTICSGSRGRALLYLGRLVQAEALLRDALVLTATAYPVFRVHVEGSLAVARAWSGRLSSAVRMAQRALHSAAEAGIERHVSCADAYLALAFVARERGEDEEAERWLDEAEARARRNNRHVLVTSAVVERAALDLSAGRYKEGLDRLTRHASSGTPDPPPQQAGRIAALRARLHLSLGDADRARQALREAADPPRTEPMLVALQLAVAERSWPTARRLMAEWHDEGTLYGRLARGMWSAVVEHAAGSRAAGLRLMADVLAEAEREGYRRLFWDAGPAVLGVVRAVSHTHPSSYLRSLVESVPPALVAAGSESLVEPLSERELVVLHYLPSRLTNAEIATELYVSQNTLKTHLKHLYRKLGVGSRREAIRAAEVLGLV